MTSGVNHRTKEKALYFSTFNITFFFLLFEQGAQNLHFASGPINYVAVSVPRHR